jgi:hypothetical protein
MYNASAPHVAAAAVTHAGTATANQGLNAPPFFKST